ncbi:hypothetical protein SRB5_64160 [Streptomyces sp. RB5]|uniref:Integral membrane protein n=1 Tax=Streptomyces smaragdinus TaxID=2585196 RepID=A0A7K0CRV2_9ACTN|nr:hypothetical protein [Streptomyces smaragdinus]MQY16218.1 hypothetical protein [Streptomyces smaragdinus]
MFGPAPLRTGPGAGVITVRVLLAALPLLSVGLLAWGTTLRIAIMRQRALEWVLFGAHTIATVVCAGTVGSLPETNRWTDVTMGALLVMAIATTAWFLVADIRHYNAPRPYIPPPAFNPYQQPYPYEQPAPPPSPRISPELDDLSELLRREQDGR